MSPNYTETFKALSDELGLAVNYHHEAFVSFIVNEYQELFIRINSLGKANATLTNADMRKTLEKCSELYLDDKQCRLTIGFNIEKDIKAIAKDIKRRLLDTQFQADALTYLIERVADHKAYYNAKQTKADKLTQLGLRQQEHESYFYEDGKQIVASLTYNELKISGIDEKTFYALIKLALSAAKEEE